MTEDDLKEIEDVPFSERTEILEEIMQIPFACDTE
jgi:hypothetical protein